MLDLAYLFVRKKQDVNRIAMLASRSLGVGLCGYSVGRKEVFVCQLLSRTSLIRG
jgi:phage host-nuclease inhibitor protein Gam